MKKLILILFVTLAGKGFGQMTITPVLDNQDNSIHTKADQPASFPGGETEMMKFISSNVKYPETEKTNKVEGICYVQFIVEKDGTLTDVKILKGVEKGPGCDAEWPARLAGTRDQKYRACPRLSLKQSAPPARAQQPTPRRESSRCARDSWWCG